MVVTLHEVEKVSFHDHLLATNGFHVKAENERFQYCRSLVLSSKKKKKLAARAAMLSVFLTKFVAFLNPLSPLRRKVVQTLGSTLLCPSFPLLHSFLFLNDNRHCIFLYLYMMLIISCIKTRD